MTTSLSERYIAATIKGLPEHMHDEVRLELEASIGDAVEARIEDGDHQEVAERAVLTELGDPAVLAAGYADRPLQLIGPKYFLTWWRLLKRLLVIVPIAVLVVVIITQLLSNGTLGDIIGESIAASATALVHVGFWTTLAFAVMERTGTETGVSWDLDKLPDPRQERPGAGDLIASLVFLGIMIAVILWDQTRGFIRIDDDPVPMLNPDLWPWSMVGLFAIILAEIGFAIILYVHARWNTTLAIANTVLAAIFLSWAITLLARGELFSGEFLALWIDNGVSQSALYTLGVVLGLGIVIICVWDVIDGWIKTSKSRV